VTFEQRPFRVLNIKYDTGFDLKIKEKNLELIKEFDTTIPEVVMGDVRLHQIILNLLQCFKVYQKVKLPVSLLSEDEEK
jgi:hypothetical protein